MRSHHRTWFKVILNPVLRRLGFSIVSIFQDGVLKGYAIRRYPQHCGITRS